MTSLRNFGEWEFDLLALGILQRREQEEQAEAKLAKGFGEWRQGFLKAVAYGYRGGEIGRS